MKKIAFIPVRGGSSAIPLKNIRQFCGKPLILWCIEAVINSSIFDETVVACENDKIIKCVKSLSDKKIKIYNRDPKNAQDSSSTESVMMEYINSKRLDKSDIFVLVQATSPFTQPIDFVKAMEQYETQNADSLLTCVKAKRFLWNSDGSPINYDYAQRPRRQDFEGTLMENGAFYINKVENIIKYRNRLSGKIAIYLMSDHAGIELDEEEDWIAAEQIMFKYFLRSNLKVDIKLLIMDVDGVLTDGGMYYAESGDEWKKFSTYDGRAIEILRCKGIKTAFITSENTNIVNMRAQKLKIDFVYINVNNKLEIARRICKKENITLKEVAFIGDDLNDYELLSHVGISSCPANAHNKIKSIPNIIRLNKSGGEGVIREFVDLLINK